MSKLLWICLGGAAGTGVRYLLSEWLRHPSGFTFGTLAVNVLGSFLLGVLIGLWGEPPYTTRQLVLTTGFMGGFTTYSTFNAETLKLLRGPAPGLGVLYLAATVAGCLLAGLLGLTIGRRLAG